MPSPIRTRHTRPAVLAEHALYRAMDTTCEVIDLEQRVTTSMQLARVSEAKGHLRQASRILDTLATELGRVA